MPASCRALLGGPNFYLSEYLESHREEYYERLLAISRDGDWTGWCVFFLKALITQAEVNQRRAQSILDLYRIRKEWIIELTHSQYAVRALDWMFEKPIFKAADFIAATAIPEHTGKRILREVRGNGMLKEMRTASGRRAAILCFPELLNIAEGHEAF